MVYIYRIECKRTGCAYVGQTDDLRDRWQKHLTELRKGRHYNDNLQAAYNDGGARRFRIVVVQECHNRDEACLAETAEIDRLMALGLAYNRMTNVSGVFGGTPCDETRERMRQASLGERNHQYGLTGCLSPNFGRKHSDETLRRISEAHQGDRNPMYGTVSPMRGKKHTEEARAKIAAARTGTTMSEEQKALRSAMNSGKENPFYGRKHTAESIAKMSAAHTGVPSTKKGVPLSEETRRKLSAALMGRTSPNKGKPSPMRGKTVSPEVRQRMVDAANLRWARKRGEAT